MPLTLNGTTGIAGVDGSASTPAVQGSDTNTGEFFPAADTIAWTTGGSERMRVDSSGNVGVGTSSPASDAKLVISKNGAAGLEFSIDNATAGVNRIFSYNRSTSAGVPIAFNAGSGEAMRIDSSGNLLVNTTSAWSRLAVQHAGASQFGITTVNTDTSGVGQTSVAFVRNGSYVGTINTTSSATSYNTSSDYRLKHSVTPITTGVATVSALKPVTYKWNIDDSDGEGFIAHELQSVIPLAVTGEKDAVDADGNPIHQGVDYSKIVVHLVAAVQELSAKVDAQAAEIAALKANAPA